MVDQPPFRFAVAHHTPGAALRRTRRAHFDWMFQIDDVLWTFATEPIDSFDQSIEIEAERLADHRLDYLNITGEISSGRGNLRRVIEGDYLCRGRNVDQLLAEIRWQSDGQFRSASVDFYRQAVDDDLLAEESRDGWRLRLDPC